MDCPPLILASASPRRRDLLAAAGVAFALHPTEIDESPAGARPGSGATELATALAVRKALAACAALGGPGRVLAADTIVVAPEGDLLGKPADAAEARRLLSRLSGRRHRVVTGVALADAASGCVRARAAESEVLFRDLAPADIEVYIALGLWCGKAGGYGAQDDPTPVAEIRGSRSNVVGLPMEVVMEMLASP